MSYVTGAHNMKFGTRAAFSSTIARTSPTTAISSYRVNNGVPNRITQTALPFQVHQTRRYDAFYAQEQWTRGRMTLQGALRFDHAWSYFPEQRSGRRTTCRSRAYPRDGRHHGLQGPHAARRRRLRRVRERQDVAQGERRQVSRAGQQRTATTRIDQPDRAPGHDVRRPSVDRHQRQLRAGLRSAEHGRAGPPRIGGDVCGAGDDELRQAGVRTTYDPAILGGWGVRPTTGASACRCSRKCCRASRWKSATSGAGSDTSPSPTISSSTPSDFAHVQRHGAVGSAFADGGGLCVSGLYDVNPDRFGSRGQLRDLRGQLRRTQYQRYNGLLLNVSARPRNGLTFQGGINTGKTVTDNCEVARRCCRKSARSIPYCQQRAGTRHARHRPRLVHDPEDRRAVRRDDSEAIRARSLRRTGTPPTRRCADARPEPRGRPPNVTINLLGPARCGAIA